MAPSRNVVKIAVQMREAIPQLIQLDQVAGPVCPPPTPPNSGAPPSPQTAHSTPPPGSSPTPPHSRPVLLAGETLGRRAEGGVRGVSVGLRGGGRGWGGGALPASLSLCCPQVEPASL